MYVCTYVTCRCSGNSAAYFRHFFARQSVHIHTHAHCTHSHTYEGGTNWNAQQIVAKNSPLQIALHFLRRLFGALKTDFFLLSLALSHNAALSLFLSPLPLSGNGWPLSRDYWKSGGNCNCNCCKPKNAIAKYSKKTR